VDRRTPEYESARQARRNFTAAVLHELRTPLSALSSEVEVALRRSRTPSAYREVLARVAEQAAELVELTGDLALFGDPDAFRGAGDATTDLEGLMGLLSLRFDSAMVVVCPAPANLRVAGASSMLARALRLILDHAVRYRGPGSPVRFRAVTDTAAKLVPGVDLVLDAATPGFSRTTWHYLIHDEFDSELIGRSGLMRLQAASHVIRMSGGSIEVEGPDGAARVIVRLPLVSN
jgi:two-component system heavy metal sensor histidine kinase CusS